MVKNLINEIEQAMLGSLNNEQLAQLRKVLDYSLSFLSILIFLLYRSLLIVLRGAGGG